MSQTPTPGPYAGSPGSPMPPYDRDAAAGPQDQPPTSGPYAGSPGSPMPAYDRDAAAGPRDHPTAIVAFILGIFSVVAFPLVGPVAWILASKALGEIDRSNGTAYTNRGLAVAGKVLGIIGTVFLALGVIAVIVFVVYLTTAAPRNS